MIDLIPLALAQLEPEAASPTLLSRLAAAWAYIVLGATSIITEEAAPLLGGLAAHDGHLGVRRVFLACALGSWGAVVLLYLVGSRTRFATSPETRWPKLRATLLRQLELVGSHPWRASLAVRFAYGLRIVLPIACGAARVPFAVYVIGTGISSVLWSGIFTLLGWTFGETALLMLGHVRRYEDHIAVGIVALLVLGFVVLHRRGRVAREVRHVVEHAVAGRDAPDDPQRPRPTPTPPPIDRRGGGTQGDTTG